MKKDLLRKIMLAALSAALCVSMIPVAGLTAVSAEVQGEVAAGEESQVGQNGPSGQETGNDTQEPWEDQGIGSGEIPKEGEEPEEEVQPVPDTVPQVVTIGTTTLVLRGTKGVQYSLNEGKTVKSPAGPNSLVSFLSLKPGTAYTIMHRTAAAGEKKPSPWVTVKTITTLKAAKPVEEVKKGSELSAKKLRITRGRTYLLTLAGSGKGKAVKLKKDQKKILTIKKAGKNRWKLKMLAPGKVTVKIKVGGAKKTCKVTVLPYKIGKHSNKFFAHRGIGAKYPENTRVALKKAMEAGFYGTNFDLWPSKPDSKGKYEFIVSHDNSLKKMTAKKGSISGTTASKILKMKVTKGHNAKKYKQKMMRMEDAIAITEKYSGHGQIEMKCIPGKHWSSAQTTELVRRLTSLKHPERYQVESMDPVSLRNFKNSVSGWKNESQKSKLKKIKLNLVCSELSGDTEKFVKLCKIYQFDNMPTYYKKVSKKVAGDCRAAGIGIAAYAHMSEDSNLVAKKMEPLGLDFLVLPSVPWYSGK